MTPRTDALEAEFPLASGGYIFDHARALERERTALHDVLAALVDAFETHADPEHYNDTPGEAALNAARGALNPPHSQITSVEK